MRPFIIATAGALLLAAPASASIPNGDYEFNLPGIDPLPVNVEACGLECLTLSTPSGFRLDLMVNHRGTRYEGLTSDPGGALCGDTPTAADVFYSVDLNGLGGVVEVIGSPCGPGNTVAPLAFNLTPTA